MKIDNRGFTLVETIASLAIVAILSTAIFQMFVLSGNFNHQAKEMDIANVLVVHQAEEFKNDPVQYSTDPQYFNPRYYDRAGVSQTDATGAAFKVESEVTPSDAGSNQGNAPGNGYYPSFVTAINLSAYCDVQITEIQEQANDGSQQIKYKIEAKASSDSTYTELARVDPSILKNNLIPIEMDFPNGGTYPRTLNVTNNSSAEAEFYVFHAQVTGHPEITGDQMVVLNNVGGAASISYVPADSSGGMKNYQLTLNVYRLNKGSSENLLTTYTVNKYHPN